jgi:hypothetical protein
LGFGGNSSWGGARQTVILCGTVRYRCPAVFGVDSVLLNRFRVYSIKLQKRGCFTVTRVGISGSAHITTYTYNGMSSTKWGEIVKPSSLKVSGGTNMNHIKPMFIVTFTFGLLTHIGDDDKPTGFIRT